MSTPPPFKPKLPPAMVAPVDRLVEIYRGLMRQHNAGKGRVDRQVLENIDLTRRELVLLADTLDRQPPDFQVGRALQAIADSATELARAYQSALAGNRSAAQPPQGRPAAAPSGASKGADAPALFKEGKAA